MKNSVAPSPSTLRNLAACHSPFKLSMYTGRFKLDKNNYDLCVLVKPQAREGNWLEKQFSVAWNYTLPSSGMEL